MGTFHKAATRSRAVRARLVLLFALLVLTTVGMRGKGESPTGTTHLGFRLVKTTDRK